MHGYIKAFVVAVKVRQRSILRMTEKEMADKAEKQP